MSLTVYRELLQGSEEWLQARCGVLTASVIGQLITPKTVKPASNDTSRALTATLAAERITGHVEPIHVTADMERGTLDEPFAREVYAEHYAPVEEIGFMTRDDWGFTLGYSPDGLAADDGLIEIKSRRQKKHLQTILADEVPIENMAQLQCGLLVSGREWIDYISWSGGMPMWVKRVTPDRRWFDAIKAAAGQFEQDVETMVRKYGASTVGLVQTERIDHFADVVIKL